MPIYEYRCRDCRRISDFLVLNPQNHFTPNCRRCGSPNMERVVSRVNVRLSEETRLERLADPALWGGVMRMIPRAWPRC